MRNPRNLHLRTIGPVSTVRRLCRRGDGRVDALLEADRLAMLRRMILPTRRFIVGGVVFSGLFVATLARAQRSSGDSAAACRAHQGADPLAAQSVVPELVAARTVFLSSELTVEARREEVRRELQQWRRWVEVSRPEIADVVLSTTQIHGEGGGTTQEVSIRARASGAALWVSSGRDVAAALKALEHRLPSLDACGPTHLL